MVPDSFEFGDMVRDILAGGEFGLSDGFQKNHVSRGGLFGKPVFECLPYTVGGFTG
jgi:hypothetical protein